MVELTGRRPRPRRLCAARVITYSMNGSRSMPLTNTADAVPSSTSAIREWLNHGSPSRNEPSSVRSSTVTDLTVTSPGSATPARRRHSEADGGGPIVVAIIGDESQPGNQACICQGVDRRPLGVIQLQRPLREQDHDHAVAAGGR